MATETPYQKFNLVDGDGNLIVSASSENQELEADLLASISNKLMPAGSTASYIGTSAGANLKSSAGFVYAITCSNSGADTAWFQLFQKASPPALNDTPARSFPVYGNNGILILGQDILGGTGISLSTGISWGISIARLTYTASTASQFITTVRWA
jgi:hypothetical protein